MPKVAVRKRFRRLESLNHATTVLARTDHHEWGNLYLPAIKQLMSSDSDHGPKIKQSSYQTLLDTKYPITLIPRLLAEHEEHRERGNDKHKGGGLHEALGVVVDAIANDNGNFDLGPDKGHRELTAEEHDYANITDLAYDDKKTYYKDWYRLTDYNSRYGSFWQNADDRVVLAVRGTKNLRDMWQNTKMFFGSQHVEDQGLYDSIEKFTTDFPNQKWDASAHSLGSEMLMNGLEKYGYDPEEIILFNPGASPFQSRDHIKKHIENSHVKMFLNKGDVLSSTYNQLLDDGDLNRVVFSPRSPGRLKVHGLAQWK